MPKKTPSQIELDKLISFFRTTEGDAIGRQGDHDGTTPAVTAIRAMRDGMKARKLLDAIIDADDHNTGAEPSLSVLYRTIDEARAVLFLPPSQRPERTPQKDDWRAEEALTDPHWCNGIKRDLINAGFSIVADVIDIAKRKPLPPLAPTQSIDAAGNPRLTPTVVEQIAIEALNEVKAWHDSDSNGPLPVATQMKMDAALLLYEARRKA